MLDFRNEFISSLGEPLCSDSLNEYLDFVKCSRTEKSALTQNHHILPRSKFPHLVNDRNNIVTLTVTDHRRAHILLAKAYCISEFIYPIRWMWETLEDYEIYLALKSAAVAEWWKTFKTTPEFAIWREKRIAYLTDPTRRSPSINVRDATIAKYGLEYMLDASSRGGKNVDRIRKQAITMKKLFEDPEVRKKKSVEVKKRWDLLSDDDRLAFSEKMDKINKDPIKRESAGKSIKEKWQDPEYVEKNKISRKAHNDMLKATGQKRANSAAMKAKWQDPVWKAEVLAKRKLKNEAKAKNESD